MPFYTMDPELAEIYESCSDYKSGREECDHESTWEYSSDEPSPSHNTMDPELAEIYEYYPKKADGKVGQGQCWAYVPSEKGGENFEAQSVSSMNTTDADVFQMKSETEDIIKVAPPVLSAEGKLSYGAEDTDDQSSDLTDFPVAVPLRGVVQHYAWGKCEETSLVAAMATAQVRAQRGPMRAPPLSRGNRFAELWMGTHPNGPSSVLVPGGLNGPVTGDGTGKVEEQYLLDVIKAKPNFWLGEKDAAKKDLPYLLKVLSVRQALSIQAHPNKKLAETLHASMPAHYPDSNHKPEICIPLGDFEALCGFRPIQEVRRNILDVPELWELCCGASATAASSSTTKASKHTFASLPPVSPMPPRAEAEEQLKSLRLRDLFGRLMRSDPLVVQRQVATLVERLNQIPERNIDEDLILRVEKDYPGDVGLFSIYFLNYVRIRADEPGRYIYCAPDEPHAYLLGEAVECMAISDNVVRAGLTPKHRDVETLLEMMTYRDDLLPELVCSGERLGPNLLKYDPPVPDFLVYEINGPLPEGLVLPHAAITACVQGSFTVDFRPTPGHRGGHGRFDAASSGLVQEGLQQITMGHTFFSQAGSELIVHGVEGMGRLFVATY